MDFQLNEIPVLFNGRLQLQLIPEKFKMYPANLLPQCNFARSGSQPRATRCARDAPKQRNPIPRGTTALPETGPR